jgi:addiction module HigA family antidote
MNTNTQPTNPTGMANPPHPGEILKYDVIADLGLEIGEAADRLGISRVTLSRVLNGHASLSPALAIRLELAGVGSARMWLSLQTAYDLAAERRRDHGAVRALATA